MRPKIIFQLNDLAFPIKVTQTGKDQFVTSYGLEEKKGDYESAARHIGFSILHALACDGKITD